MNKSSTLALLALTTAPLNAQPCTTRIAYGDDARTGQITAANQKRCYLLQGAVGELLRVTYWSDFYAVVEVVNPDGSRLCFGNWDRIEVDCRLTQDGLHRVQLYSDNLMRTGASGSPFND